MSALPSSVGAITLFVEDPERSRAFYETVFGLPVAFQDEDSAAFRFESTVVNLLRSTAANELIQPARVAPGGAGSRFQLTLWVQDADAACAALAERGVPLLNGPIDRPWGMRTACFADPDGHIWEIAQEQS